MYVLFILKSVQITEIILITEMIINTYVYSEYMLTQCLYAVLEIILSKLSGEFPDICRIVRNFQNLHGMCN